VTSRRSICKRQPRSRRGPRNMSTILGFFFALSFQQHLEGSALFNLIEGRDSLHHNLLFILIHKQRTVVTIQTKLRFWVCLLMDEYIRADPAFANPNCTSLVYALSSGMLKMSFGPREASRGQCDFIRNQNAYRVCVLTPDDETYSFSRLLYSSWACSIWRRRFCSCSIQANR
jgi:hypothetical protein